MEGEAGKVLEAAGATAEKIFGWAWDQILAHPLEIGAFVVAWILAEVLWRSTHKDPHERPHVPTRSARNSQRAVERAKKDQKEGHQNYWPLPGRLKVAAEFLYIVGGSGTGKTLRILLYVIAYCLLQGRRSIWMIDPKGELYGWTRRLLGVLSGHPAVYLISTLEGHAKRPVSPVNPMLHPEERLGFLRTAIPGTDGTKDSFFDNEAQRQAYRAAEAQIDEWGGTDLWLVYRALDNPEELDRLAARHAGLRSVWRGSDAPKGTHHDARSTALAALFALDVPRIRRIFKTRGLETGAWDTSPGFAERTVGYLCVNAFDADSAPGLVRATVDHLMRRAAGAGERGGPKVDAILEEAGTFGPLEQLNFYVNLLRGAGVNVVVVLQSIEQLWARLGRDYANSALSAGGCFVFGRMSSTQSARWVEELAGTVRVPRPRPYSPIWVGALGVFFDTVAHMLPGSSGGTDQSAPRRTDEDDRIVVPRFPARLVYGFDLDPDLQEGRWEKVRARLKLWWSRRWVMRVGQYLVLAHGKEPFVLDTRRHKQIYPLYGPRVFRRLLIKRHGGKWGEIRYQAPPKGRPHRSPKGPKAAPSPKPPRGAPPPSGTTSAGASPVPGAAARPSQAPQTAPGRSRERDEADRRSHPSRGRRDRPVNPRPPAERGPEAPASPTPSEWMAPEDATPRWEPNGRSPSPEPEPAPGPEAPGRGGGVDYGGRSVGGSPEPEDSSRAVGGKPGGSWEVGRPPDAPGSDDQSAARSPSKVECHYCGHLNEPTARVCQNGWCGTELRP